MELLCPAGSLPALKAAVDQGADAVYIGFKDQTNARHFAGLNFTERGLQQGVDYLRRHRRKLHVAINTFAHQGNERLWRGAVDQAVALGADALIIADTAILAYAARTYPRAELHLSVQASATNAAAIRFFREHFKVRRVVLPRVLSIQQVRQIARDTDAELEVFAFGSLCIMAEGRCYLSSYLTGESPNTVGACSPARFVRWEENGEQLESRLNGVLIDRFAEGEQAGYPTLCKGRFEVDGKPYHTLEEPTSLNTLSLIPDLARLGVKSVKIEGRQRSPAYVAEVTRVWRQALDAFLAAPEGYEVQPAWSQRLDGVCEGSQSTLGAFHRKWQ
ncbi:protease [Zobellella endophytica]|uniref:Ubiquinone biosynthesis protein UbiU n=1 Tax=Zobellella endophytica TaxID=2116700 RepID=A0A2P7R406_9GAMM|nr:peptidase U32 family protein [Zobellella endophytica]PSJ44928.1 protease [Zobellella endophytica]